MKSFGKIALIVLGLVVLTLASSCIQSGNRTTGGNGTAVKGKTTATGGWTGDATDFAYTTFAGLTGKASDFAGKPLVVNFWAAW